MFETRRNKIAALTVSALAAGAGALALTADTYEIEDSKWVDTATPYIHTYRIGFGDDRTWKLKGPGESCHVKEDAKITVLAGHIAMYRHKGAMGTECPHGSILRISHGDVRDISTNGANSTVISPVLGR